MKYGGDYLGGVKYSRAVLKTHPRGNVGGIFHNTFGYALETEDQWCRSGLFSEIVSHIAPFDNSHAYPIRQLLPYVLAEARKIDVISRANPRTVVMLSPFCEHNHPAKEMIPVFEAMRKAAPSCLLVNSIWKGQPVPGVITEIHLPSSRLPPVPQGEYTVAADGFGGDGRGDFPDTNVQNILQKYAGARHIRWWNFRCNGKFGHTDTAAISARTNWADEKYLRGHNALMKAREGGLTWGNTMLYKPFADDHGNTGVTKDNKLIAILPWAGKVAQVIDRNGKVIDTLGRFTPDHELGPRYYSTKYAYEVAAIARANTGSSLVAVRVGRKVTPYTDGDLRSGAFK